MNNERPPLQGNPSDKGSIVGNISQIQSGIPLDIPEEEISKEHILEVARSYKHNKPTTTDREQILEHAEEVLESSTVTPDEWQEGLKEKYTLLRQVADSNIPNSWHSLEFVLSVKSILNIKDCTLPFAGVILGAPSSNKTVSIELFRGSRQSFYTDKFTAKSFVSHTTGVKKEELPDVDLLPKIKDKFLLTPELGPLFSSRDEDLVENLGILTRVLDGHGYESDSGAHGHRGYNGEYMFVQVGAAVDIPRKVYKYLGTLGPKLYFLRVPKNVKTEADYYSQLKNDDFGEKNKAIRAALVDYLRWFDRCPYAEKVNGIQKISWDSGKDEKDAVYAIIRLAKLLAHLRGVIPTWETHDTEGSEYAYAIPTIEEPDRAMTQLRNLARGHALSEGRNYITMEDLSIVVKVVLSTAVIERVKVFDLLLKHDGRLTTSQITAALNTTSPTARRTMTEFKALGLVAMQDSVDQNKNTVKEITLKPEFSWFLESQFQNLRHGFELVVEAEEPKAKAPPSPKEALFWQIANELGKDHDGQVTHEALQQQLVSSGKFTTGEAHQAIQDKVLSNNLEKRDWHLYRVKGEKISFNPPLKEKSPPEQAEGGL